MGGRQGGPCANNLDVSVQLSLACLLDSDPANQPMQVKESQDEKWFSLCKRAKNTKEKKQNELSLRAKFEWCLLLVKKRGGRKFSFNEEHHQDDAA